MMLATGLTVEVRFIQVVYHPKCGSDQPTAGLI